MLLITNRRMHRNLDLPSVVKPLGDDVLSLWESFPEWIKGATLFIILTYLATFMIASYWTDLPVEVSTLLVYWPFAIMIWAALIWFGFSLIIMVGVWVGGLFSKEEHQTTTHRAKKVILYIPIVIGSIISVSVVFMSDIFRRNDQT
jgi:hypothetical protein